MEIFNIGIPELVIILLLMLILLGPEGMVKTARNLAQMARKLIRSPLWSDLMKAQNEIKDIPTRFVREAGIEELKAEMKQVQTDVTGEVKSIYQPIPVDPYSIRPLNLESGAPGERQEPVGPRPDQPPAGDPPSDPFGEDQP